MDSAFSFSTCDFALRDRASAFEAAFLAIGCAQGVGRIEKPLTGYLTARRFGPIDGVEMGCSNLTIQRTKRHVARTPAAGIIVIDHGGSDIGNYLTSRAEWDNVRSGDLIVGSTTETFDYASTGQIRYRAWRLPLDLFRQADLPHSPFEQGIRLPRESAIANVALNYLRELDQQGDRLGAKELEASAQIAVRLLAVALGIGGRDEPFLAAGREGQLAMLKRRIKLRLADPLLSPIRMAADFGVSVRKVHALFEASGETFGQYVLRNRLAAVRAMLMDPGHHGRSIADAAFSVGFNSLGTFYRTYRSAFDETPGDTRERSIADD